MVMKYFIIKSGIQGNNFIDTRETFVKYAEELEDYDGVFLYPTTRKIGERKFFTIHDDNFLQNQETLEYNLIASEIFKETVLGNLYVAGIKDTCDGPEPEGITDEDEAYLREFINTTVDNL